ncbi:hypothetical protein Q8A73_001581 [Channa argus]|nr:hypothetical protein Q8A73_001581 [Channa argus]
MLEMKRSGGPRGREKICHRFVVIIFGCRLRSTTPSEKGAFEVEASAGDVEECGYKWQDDICQAPPSFSNSSLCLCSVSAVCRSAQLIKDHQLCVLNFPTQQPVSQCLLTLQNPTQT